MRTEFVECETQEEAEEACPWGARFAEVEGGYMVFESVEDFETWRSQA